jgi:HK97 family phage portal protein
MLSETIAALPATVYASEADHRSEIFDHPIARLVKRAPNPFQSGFTWMIQTVRNVCLRGNALHLIARDPDGVPIAAWPVTPAAVTVRSDGRRIRYEVGCTVSAPIMSRPKFMKLGRWCSPPPRALRWSYSFSASI